MRAHRYFVWTYRGVIVSLAAAALACGAQQGTAPPADTKQAGSAPKADPSKRSDPLAAVKVNDKWGYVNPAGAWSSTPDSMTPGRSLKDSQA